MPYKQATHNQRITADQCKADRRRYDRERGRDRQFYGTKRWRRFRRWFLVRHPLCVECNGPANEVDHIESRRERPDLAFDESNLRALCKSCHSRRTARDQGWARGTKR